MIFLSLMSWVISPSSPNRPTPSLNSWINVITERPPSSQILITLNGIISSNANHSLTHCLTVYSIIASPCASMGNLYVPLNLVIIQLKICFQLGRSIYIYTATEHPHRPHLMSISELNTNHCAYSGFVSMSRRGSIPVCAQDQMIDWSLICCNFVQRKA